MSAMDTRVVTQVINTTRYPLSQPSSPDWKRIVSHIKHDLETIGCSVLPDFIRPELGSALQGESATLAPHAYYDIQTVNAYNIDIQTPLPADHPGRITMERGNAFVPRDRIPQDAIIHRLYTCPTFKAFIAHCFDLEQIHELADPLSALCVNVISPGNEHPWHFDTNEFTVSLLTQKQDLGGIFEYCPGIRSSSAENFEDVESVLMGRGQQLIRQLVLKPGDLQLFKGRYSLHRVSRVEGTIQRHSAIFAYTERPGVVGSVARTQQLFGRVLPAHLATQTEAVRVDPLLD